MLIFLFIFAKIRLLIGILLLNSFSLNIITWFLMGQIIISIVFLSIISHKKINFTNKKIMLKNKIKYLYDKSFKLSIYLILTIIVFLLLKNGIPLFSENANIAKVGLSKYPILMRFFRFFMPLLLVYMFVQTYKNNLHITIQDIIILSIFIISSLLMGYKGYIYTYIIIPVAIAMYYYGKLKISTFFLFILFIIPFGAFLVSYIEHADYLTSIFFILYRLTSNQAEATVYILNNMDMYNQISIQMIDLSNFMYKFIGLGNEDNFNSLVFKHIHDTNPYKMQVAIPLITEFFVEFGILGLFVISLFEIILIFYIHKLLTKLKTNSYYGIYIMASIYIIDIISNGGIIFKLFDFTLSIVFFGIIFGIIYTMSHKTLKIKYEKR